MLCPLKSFCSLDQRPLIKYWRGKGLQALLYLDDGIVKVKRAAAGHSLKASQKVPVWGDLRYIAGKGRVSVMYS